ncbi:MAG: SIS domain-containing protein [Terracidiphilus sp.]|jgi:glucosamine--fructose-6-phosphate aminotransferase (isomerizing)
MEGTKKQEPRWISGVKPPEELLQANGIQILEIECREQPERLSDLITSYATDGDLRAQLERFRTLASADGPVLFIGMGASLCSAVSGSAFLQSQGRLSFSVDAGEWLHYGAAVRNEPAISVLLTTSGESAELVEIFKSAGNHPLGLICNNPASTCWRLADDKLPILAGPEYGNATKTYINSTAASIILASEILERPWRDEAYQATRIFSTNLDRIFAMRGEMEKFCRGASNIEIIGRGAAFGGAMMSALCIREMTGCRAAAHTGAGFRHGPNLDVDASHVAVIFALGRVAPLGVKLAQECNRRGGKVVLVSSHDHDATDTLFPVRIDAVPEPWEGITSLLVPQALTLGMVERTGCRLPPRFQYGVMEE